MTLRSVTVKADIEVNRPIFRFHEPYYGPDTVRYSDKHSELLQQSCEVGAIRIPRFQERELTHRQRGGAPLPKPQG